MTLARSVVLAAALAAVLTGLWIAPEPPDWRWLPAIAAVLLSQLLRLRFRAGAGVFYVAWGEAALIVALFLVPAGWLPLTFAVGALLAIGVRAVVNRQRPPASTPWVVATLSLAAGVGAALSVSVADPFGGPLTPAVAAGLALGSVGYLVVTTVATSVLAGLRDGASVRDLLMRTTQRKLPMFAGNVAVGATIVALAEADWRWLLGLPLLLMLVHSMYAGKLRGTEHRRMWSAFARATRALNQSDEHTVAVAGTRGAIDVFAVGRAEVEVTAEDGARRWVADQTGEVHRMSGPGPDDAGATEVPLLASGVRIGTLRLYFPKLAGPNSGDESALQAYADALAAALHDTVTHAELHDLLARSAHNAQHDPLTGLLNRSTLLAQGDTALQLVPHAEPVAMLLVDIDHFREINNTLGHNAGDEVLKVTAGRLRTAARPDELLARLGGDEFALLITAGEPPGPGGPQRRAVRRGRELVEQLAQPADISGVSVSIEASVGVVVAPAGTADVSELLRRADAALLLAKHGSTSVGVYDSDHDPGSTDRPAVLAELRDALHRDSELTLLLQPVVDLRDGSAIGVEALVRWRHPRRGLLEPADFIRVVEHSDLLNAFTEYVVDKALTVAARLGRRGTPIPIAVNLSARSLLNPGLPKAISGLLRKHRVPGRHLILEITETVMTRELPGIDEALASLRALGVRLAVDDFGTGYASLTFLTRVPLDEVKVDRALVAKMMDSPEAAAIVRTTVELGRDLGLRVVAEGVETAAQEEMLVNLGCVAAQGFHFAEPTPVDRLGGVLRELESRVARAQVIRLQPADGEPRRNGG